MTWFDWLVAGAFGYFIFHGFRKGIVQQIFDLLGSVAALILAFYFYRRAGEYFGQAFGLSAPLSNVLGFILIVVGIVGVVSFLGRRWHETHKNDPIAILDGGLGAIFGGLKAAVILIMVLLILLALPWNVLHGPIETSSLAGDLLRLAPLFYVIQDNSLPADLPRLVVSPEGLQLRAIQDPQLNGATCIVCGAKVKYNGMVKQGLMVYPQTICPNCHRTSDGCLTFEGFHKLHGVCPYEKLGSMGTIDCKVWPNPEPATVRGKCPVCGKTQ